MVVMVVLMVMMAVAAHRAGGVGGSKLGVGVVGVEQHAMEWDGMG